MIDGNFLSDKASFFQFSLLLPFRFTSKDVRTKLRMGLSFRKRINMAYFPPYYSPMLQNRDTRVAISIEHD